MKKILHISLALGLVFGLSGCDFLNFLGEQIEEQDLGVSFDPETGEVSFNVNGNEEETSAEVDTDLPEGWDSAVVVYPDGEITESFTTISKGETTATLTLLADDSLATVRDFYRGVLVAGGYTLGESTDIQINATKNNQTLTLNLSLKGDQTQIKMILEY